MFHFRATNLVDVVVDGGVVAHGADHGELGQGGEGGAVDLATVQSNITTGLIGRARDFEFVELGSVALRSF